MTLILCGFEALIFSFFVGEGGAGRGRKLIGRNCLNLIVGWCGQFLFFVVLRQFSQVARKSNFDS